MWPFKKKTKFFPPKPRPELKQFGNLRLEDFVRHSIWISCHTVDYDEPWYDETTEETFRPHTGNHPVSSDEMYLVRCYFTLADGTKLDGFATPAAESEDWGTIQPQIFVADGRRFGFWLGMLGQPGVSSEFCRVLSRDREAVFPLSFAPFPALTSAQCSGSIQGFMKKSDDSYDIVAD